MMQQNPLYRTKAIQKQQTATDFCIQQVTNSSQYMLVHAGQAYHFLSREDAERYANRLGIAKPLI